MNSLSPFTYFPCKLNRFVLSPFEKEHARPTHLGGLTEKDKSALTAECKRWRTRVEELETIAGTQGLKAVMPILR